MSIGENYISIKKEIENISDKNIHILAVSKTFSSDRILEAAASGITMFGESRVQEAVPKIERALEFYPNIEFHFIGKIQTNKVKQLVKYFYLIHSIDRYDAAEAVNRAAKNINKIQDVLIQLNLAREPQKNGIFYENLESFTVTISKMTNLNLKGFMIIPPYEEIPKKNIKYFNIAHNLFEQYKNNRNYNIEILSMGMSGDYIFAIQNGSTLVRIGTKLFGGR